MEGDDGKHQLQLFREGQTEAPGQAADDTRLGDGDGHIVQAAMQLGNDIRGSLILPVPELIDIDDEEGVRMARPGRFQQVPIQLIS